MGGSQSLHVDKIVLDFCRLALVRNASPTTDCFFVLSDRSREVNTVVTALMHKMPLMKKPRREMIRILQIPADNQVSRQRSYPLTDWANRSVVPTSVQTSLPTTPAKIRSTR
ncbi:hypothetical protein Pure05_42300 [Paenarthrobacter ureafaciens]|nr:hypothetical protein Pure01_42320 [Paenarthrobacter ureafaciens]GLU66003.1 hypothetical protein Pure02_42530 [Paenarthrobacter ureafaciens]GLU69633.1 hypothetical protein Pure03_36090 [Paenarthrobacter ureafaciens]GLU74534.1 hypothetical protein Pure04_42490 [Paenarthrobacter ureafaciens]GLU78790.1 hypothetical protein Pure05_42300 [Paenarthrobacter ureafaciens]